ncbi:RNA-directed DNA polymerase [Geodermatophilus normandii]|uniref:RNA-directed DNA polymerase n=1 Tax=Geodermatophilus normandii TaxID=1137989 RepID=UPI00147468D5|nr:RNA-directed DNA polymerase [Geodermatophilus normandii]
MASGLLTADELEDGAAVVGARSLDRFPPLISDLSLTDAAGTLAEHAAALMAAGKSHWAETLTMSRSGSGPRPVIVLAPASRAIYTALVARLAPALPEPSRGEGAWEAHTQFGLEGPHGYVVELDIAACYEYLDHSILADELLLRSMAPAVVAELAAVLRDVSSRGRGLPQMLSASDHLADAYLSILDRRLMRDGYDLHRFADDTRITASTWEDANRVIERAAEHARDLGLILASKKTRPYKRETLVERKAAEEAFFDKYYREARKSLTQTLFIMSDPYGDIEQMLLGADVLESRQVASRKVVEDWATSVQAQDSEDHVDVNLRNFQSRAVSALVRATQRLEDETLLDLVFYDPQRLQSVSTYLRRRALSETFSDEHHWRTVGKLIGGSRESAWTSLWLLNIVQALPESVEPEYGAVMTWVEERLSDRHEVVRCQAAWVMASRQALPKDAIADLYRRSTPLTQNGLAAAVAKQADSPVKVRGAVVDDSPLNKAAAQWVEQQASS